MKKFTGAFAKDQPAKLAIFKRALVTSVTTFQHGLSLSFNDSPLALDIEGQAELRSASGSETLPATDHIAMAKRLLDLLGRRLAAVQVATDGVLTLAFEGGPDLILRGASPGSQNYVIFLPDESTLVG